MSWSEMNSLFQCMLGWHKTVSTDVKKDSLIHERRQKYNWASEQPHRLASEADSLSFLACDRPFESRLATACLLAVFWCEGWFALNQCTCCCVVCVVYCTENFATFFGSSLGFWMAIKESAHVNNDPMDNKTNALNKYIFSGTLRIK